MCRLLHHRQLRLFHQGHWDSVLLRHHHYKLRNLLKFLLLLLLLLDHSLQFLKYLLQLLHRRHLLGHHLGQVV